MILEEVILSANTGADAIKRAPIVEEDTGVRCLRIGDVSQKREYSFWGFTKTSAQDYKRFKLDVNDLIVARTGNSIGVNCLIEDEINSVFNNGLIRIKAKTDKILPRYLWYLVNSKSCQDYIQTIAYGTSTQPNMKIKDFLKYSFRYQSLEEQRKIVHVIDAFDKKIKANKQINENLSQQLRLIFQHTFLDEEHPEWPVEKLGSFLSLERGLSYKGKFLSDSEGVPMVNLGNILPNSVFRPEKLKFYTGEFKAKVIVKPGDIVVANTDLTQAREVLGSAIFIPDLGYPTIICSHHISIVRDCRISKHFIHGMLNSPSYRERVIGFATGTTVLALPSETILNCEFALPPNELIIEYDSIAESYYQKSEQLRKENQQLLQLRDTLLPQLMSGQLDVSEVSL